METNTSRKTVLIVDDTLFNRELLSEILSDEYDIIEAENGVQAVQIMEERSAEISIVLLDFLMPELDGFGVLHAMHRKNWIEDIPVIMLSAENSADLMERAFDLGVNDFIRRPFDSLVVRRRIVNTILLYAKQKTLTAMVEQQIYEKEQQSSLMINILSHTVEFRNGESGLHVLHIKTLTELILDHLIYKTDRYKLTREDVKVISTASALHDIGKIAIPEHIINKPGKLTDEEFAIMKTHAAVGAEMLDGVPCDADYPLVQVARDICRWHHERYDGRGYPDGLVGEEIPISAQVTALADVYDALTSERVYKAAFSHEKAVSMIVNGECGSFNPLLLECLLELQGTLEERLK